MKYSLIFLLLFSCSQYQQPSEYDHAQDSVLRSQLVALQDSNRVLNSKIQRLDSAVRILYPKVSKLDSAVDNRQWKRDRAARRGLFWGGIAEKFVK